MKKRMSVLFGFTIIVAFAAGVFAQEAIEKVEAYLRYDYEMEIDGQEVVLNDPPLVYNGRTYLPVRSLALLMNSEVNWNEHTKTIIIRRNQPIEQKPKDEETQSAETSLPTIHHNPIRFGDPSGYEMHTNDQKLYVVGNEYRQSMYIRVEDLEPLELNYEGATWYEEEHTGQHFILAHELRRLLQEVPLFTRLNEPIYTGPSDSSIREALLRYGRDAVYIKQLDGERYELLYSRPAGEHELRDVRVQERSGRFNVVDPSIQKLYEEKNERKQ